MRVSMIAATLAVLSLAACGQGGDAAKDDAATSADATASAAAPDLEAPAPGKWRMTSQMASGPGAGMAMPAAEVCITAADTTAAQKAQLPPGADCQNPTIRKEGATTVSHVQCTSNGSTVVVDSRITGDMKTKYTTEMTTKTTPEPAPGMGEIKMTITAERIGDC